MKLHPACALATSVAATLILSSTPSTARGAAGPPSLSVAGRHLVDPDGHVVTLRGVNLGNWFLLESWMLGLDSAAVPDHHTFVETLRERFGPERADALMETHYASWIQREDFDRVKSFGFNAVRLPFHYALVEKRGGVAGSRETIFDFRWLDHAIALARDAGVYVILDLHGAPGGQSIDQPSGRVGENELWTSPIHQQRTLDLWAALAERYANESAVAAYDVLNEPYGDLRQDLRGPMLDLANRLVRVIRAQDEDTLIYLPGTLQGMTFYGRPSDRGWTNVGYTEHYYPGLFGDATAMTSHFNLLGPFAESRQRFLKGAEAPFLVGEFNVVFERLGGADMMRASFDRYADLGWSATMWCYKLVHPSGGLPDDNWPLVTNAEPVEPIDVFADTDDEIEAKLRHYGQMKLDEDNRLRERLTADASSFAFELPSAASVTAGDDALPSPWLAHNVGGATPGGQQIEGSRWVVQGGGRDIFGRSDAFRFVSRSVEGDFGVWTGIESFTARDRYAKAGLMLRSSLEHDAAHVLLHVFPRGEVVLAQRTAPGGETTERTLAFTGFPVALGLQRVGDDVHAWVADSQREYTRVAAMPWKHTKDRDVRTGIALLAHDEDRLVEAAFLPPTWSTAAPKDAQPPNGSADAPSNLLDRPATKEPPPTIKPNWFYWGDGWQPLRGTKNDSGMPAMRLVVDKATPLDAGTWHDVTEGVEPGRWYAFRLNATLKGSAPLEVEARLESPPLEPGLPWLTVASETYELDPGTPAQSSARLSVSGPALTDRLRLLVRVSRPDGASGRGELRLGGFGLSATEH